MENISRPVVVKRMPETMNLKQARNFLKEVEPFLNADRPQLVFDMSQVRHIDAGGVDVLLQCMRDIIKHDGDLKLASVSQQAAVVLELTRTGPLVRDLRQFHPGGEELQQLPAECPEALLPTSGAPR